MLQLTKKEQLFSFTRIKQLQERRKMNISPINIFSKKAYAKTNSPIGIKEVEIKPNISQKTLPFSDDETLSWHRGGNKSFITSSKGYLRNPQNKTTAEILNWQFEIINNSKGEPSKIIYTKHSNSAFGVHEKTLYNLANYPEELDMIKEIKEGNIKGGTPLCKAIKNKDGSIEYFENLNSNGLKIQKHYIKKDENYNYNIKITDEKGKEILKLNRTFEKDENHSTTTINGKKYSAYFNNEEMTIKLVSDEGEKTIDFKEKFNERDYTCNEILFNTAKKMPADALEILDKHVYNWQFSSGLDSSYMRINKVLSTNDDLPVIYHELGHAFDFQNAKAYLLMQHNAAENENLVEKYYEDPNIFSNDEELNKIYKEEYDAFKKQYTVASGENFVKYFKPQDKNNTKKEYERKNITEVFAEANLILTTPFNDSLILVDRTQFLAQNFPKTIARAATLLGLNGAK